MNHLLAPDRSKRAFEVLYERVGRRLLVHLVRRMHDVHAATELWAECLALAFEGWPRCKATSWGEAEAWIFGIAHNRLAAYYRSGALERRALERLQWTVPTIDNGELEQLERAAELDLLRSALADALDDLPARRRQALRLRIVGGLPYSEVAARLGCSEQAARAQVSRGLRRLAQLLDKQQLLEGGVL